MNADSMQIILIVFSVIAMLEAVWILAAPESYKKFARLWLRAAAQVPTLLPITLGIIGIFIFGMIVRQQPLYRTLGMLLGVFFLMGALLYANLDAMTRVCEKFLSQRSKRTLRLIAAAVLAVAALVFWIAITGK